MIGLISVLNFFTLYYESYHNQDNNFLSYF
jgi:hypothetical protein